MQQGEHIPCLPGSNVRVQDKTNNTQTNILQGRVPTAKEPRGWEGFRLALPTGIVHVSGVARRALEPGSGKPGAPPG